MTFSVIILAAGQGLRMRSNLAKVLHPIGGVPMLEHVIKTAKSLKPEKIIIVYGHHGDQVKAALAKYPELIFAEQKNPQGTGHAVLQALPFVSDSKSGSDRKADSKRESSSEKVLILCGDAPLVKSESLQQFIQTAEASELSDVLKSSKASEVSSTSDALAASKTKQSPLGVVTANAYPPTGFGRIIRDKNNRVQRIVEEKEATAEEKKITEINTGIFFVATQKLREWLPRLTANNSQKEYYLTDIIALALQEKANIVTHLLPSSTEALGINDKQQLAAMERIYQTSRAEELMQQGVTLLDPARLDIRGCESLHVGKDVTIDVNVILQGNVTLEDNVKIGPNVVIKDSLIQNAAEILANSVIENASIGPKAIIGPFARVRPGTITGEAVKIGNFVETKNAKIGNGSKINHLSYVGDAVVGKDVNIGAGTITCNYDGKNKHQTTIEDNVFIGSDTQLIAPVTIGAGATIGAGTTVVKDVPSNHLIHNQIQHKSVAKEK